MIPYFIYGIIIGLPCEIIRLKIQNHPIDMKKLLLDIITFSSGYSPTWFLCTLFIIFIIEYTIYYFIVNNYIRMLIHVVLLIVGYLLPVVVNEFARLKTTIFCTFFFYVGKIIHDRIWNDLVKSRHRLVLTSMLLVTGTCGALLNSTISASQAKFGDLVLCVYSAFCLILGMAMLCEFLCKIKLQIIVIIKKLFVYLGENSIIILCTHSFLLLSARFVAKMIGIGIHDIPILGLVLYVVVLSYFVIYIIKRFIGFSIGK